MKALSGLVRGGIVDRLLLAGLLASAACGGGGSGSQEIAPDGNADRGCDGTCAQRSLAADDVRRVIAQGVAQAESMGVAATIAVVDRVGNVLAVYAMDGAPTETTITACPAPVRDSCPDGVPVGGLQGVELISPALFPGSVFMGSGAALAAISKAGTGAYLSSQGNAFSTRTASQIVQSHFNPQERRQPGGPLFGVQFSQLPCGDLVTGFPSNQGTGPNRLPLGFSADPGGIPLYKPSTGPGISGWTPVGGVGVEFDGQYTLDPSIYDVDVSPEEIVATAAATGFEAPGSRRADRISVGGRTLRYVDSEASVSAGSGPLPSGGRLLSVPLFCDATVRAGTTLGTAASGVLSTSFEGRPAEILVDPEGDPRFPPKSAPGPDGLTAAEVSSILDNALEVIARTRAQIRQPLGTPAQVSVSVVGLGGEVLGLVRAVDAPVFGIDVSLQKARAALFFSSPTAAEQLRGAGDVVYPVGGGVSSIGGYVDATRSLLDLPGAFAGGTAWADRSIGNLARPFFPDGIDSRPAGSLSKPQGQWSPFNTGLQLDLVLNQLVAILSLQPAIATPTPAPAPSPTPERCSSIPQLPNGIQIFAGGVPIYRGSRLVGAVGVSGDGIDQDDMIAFLGLHQAGIDTGTIGNAPPSIRADRISVEGSFLRYVNCPVQPFLDSDRQGACDGL